MNENNRNDFRVAIREPVALFCVVVPPEFNNWLILNDLSNNNKNHDHGKYTYLKDGMDIMTIEEYKDNPEKNIKPYIGLIHRLDRVTSGINIFARHLEASKKYMKVNLVNSICFWRSIIKIFITVWEHLLSCCIILYFRFPFLWILHCLYCFFFVFDFVFCFFVSVVNTKSKQTKSKIQKNSFQNTKYNQFKIQKKEIQNTKLCIKKANAFKYYYENFNNN